ncbi:hypothetical protein C5S35_12015 [Candidatus Methanophagaceae archaeon]|nr:hypothetical protein C5S35_12015 [Methanophagales archaeon]
MNPRSFLKVMILLMLFPSLICLFLPDTIASVYTKTMLPLCLLIGSVLSLRVASMYKKWLRNAFIFLALFLFLMMLANIDLLMNLLRMEIGELYPVFVLFMQWTTYTMLVIFSFYVLKVTELREIGIKGWIAILAVLFFSIIIVMYSIPSELQQIFVFHYADVYTISLLLIRLLDVAIVIMLVPVVILYAKQMRLEGRESITFTAITCGIILSLTAAYVYEIVFGVPLYVVIHAVYHTGSILDTLYLFSYLIIAVGLYVHKKYDEWGFQMIEKALAGG